MSNTIKAVLLREADKKVTAAIEQVPVTDLPDGDVTVRVAYTTLLNYKDGMVLNDWPSGKELPPIYRASTSPALSRLPENPDFKPGDKVVLTGWRVGEMHWGGYAELARVKGDWLVKLPDGISLGDAMAIGTAGFTAMLAVDTLERHGMSNDQGEVLVTGRLTASGRSRSQSFPISAITWPDRPGDRAGGLSPQSWRIPSDRPGRTGRSAITPSGS